jgi:predicted transcriptional regulator
MSSSLEDIEFLARSPHRVEVLEALADAPRTRHELKERADVSRVTIRRLLDDLADRGWIEHDNGQYEATASGRVTAREFARLQSNLTVAGRLDDALEWLPTEEFDFDLAYLHDADVLSSESWESQTEVIRHAADLVEGTRTITGTAIGFSHEVVSEIRDHVVAGDGEFEVVVDETCLRMIRNDSGLRERFHDMLASGNATLHRYDGENPLHMVITFDDLVSICGHVDEGPPPGALESTEPTVLEWARSYFEGTRAASEPIEIEALAPGSRESS